MISSRTSLGRTPRDRRYLFCEFVLTYFITSEYNYFSKRHTNRFLLQQKILSHTNSLTRLIWNKWVTREVLQNENAYFARTFATLDAKLAGNAKWTVVGNFVRSGYLARENYENVQNAKFVQKFVHTFARTVAKLRSNFRFAEPFYWTFLKQHDGNWNSNRESTIHVQHILAGTTNRLQIVFLALAARNFIWGSAISAVLTNNKSNSPDE